MIEDISLSSNQINENNEISSIIGEFSSVDESSTATHQYSWFLVMVIQII